MEGGGERWVGKDQRRAEEKLIESGTWKFKRSSLVRTINMPIYFLTHSCLKGGNQILIYANGGLCFHSNPPRARVRWGGGGRRGLSTKPQTGLKVMAMT